MADEDQILYEAADKVAVITLNRPHRANAQTLELLDDLNAAFEKAAADDGVRVIVLRGNGKHFSSGHDLSGSTAHPDNTAHPDKITLQRIYALESRRFLDYSLRWRNIPKPTIASVQGKAIAGALLLVWPMDLIVAAENAEFSDPVVFMGIGGVEYHGHTWEFGPRKAKEILFTGRAVGAREAEHIGMVNKVVPLESLQEETMALASQIAQNDPFGLRQAKRAVNQTLDTMGFSASIASCFDMHHLGHARALAATDGKTVVLADLARMKAAGRSS